MRPRPLSSARNATATHHGGSTRRRAAAPTVRPELLAAVLTSEAELEPLVERWDALAVTAGRPFCGPAWMLAWWRHVAPRGLELRVVALTEGDQLVALAPFYLEPRRGGKLRLLSADVSVRLDILCIPGREEAVATKLAAALGDAGDAAVVALEGCPADSPWPALLAEHWPKRGAWWLRDHVVAAPTLDLRGRRYEHWLGAKSKNFRSQMAQSRRRLERAGAVVRMASTEAEIRRAAEALTRLHEGRWEWRGGSAVLRDGLSAMLADAALTLAETERCRLWSIEIEGELVSVQLFVEAGGELGYWLGGFDERWAKGRPAFVAFMVAIEDAMERGEDRLDFGGGAQPYKYRFADGEDSLCWHLLAPRGPRYPLARSRLLGRQMRRALADRLSPETRERLRAKLPRLPGRGGS